MKKLIALILSLVMAAAVGVVPCIAAGAANNGVVKTEFYYLSKDPDYRIHAISWKPKGDVKGVIQFVHGMAEYIDRYDSMARWFASRGYAVYGNDHIGHGLSVTPKHPLGDLGGRNQDGEIFVKDVKTLSDMAKKENPGKPFYLFGHSMGSFIGRCYAAEYGDSLTAAIFCGSGMVPPETCEKLGEAIEHVGMIQPENKFDQAVADIMAVTGSTDWLSVNQKNQDDYKADPLCGFAFTIRGYGQSLELIAESCDPETIGETPKDLPMFFISGSKDPVGLYGVGFNAMVNAYTKDHTKVSSKLYEGYKHEIHNDDCKDEVYADILAFIQANK